MSDTSKREKTPLALFLLSERYRLGSWRKVARLILEVTGKNINTIALENVARGKRRASDALVSAVNETYKRKFDYEPHAGAVKRCLKCGKIHPQQKRCPAKTVDERFQENASRYDAFLNDPDTRAELDRRMEWAIYQERQP